MKWGIFLEHKTFSFEAVLEVVRQEVENFGHFNTDETQGIIESENSIEFISSLKDNLEIFFNNKFFVDNESQLDDFDDDTFLLGDDDDDDDDEDLDD
jgi:hypothetical protein